MVILLNCVTLGMYQPCENIDCSSNRCQILQVQTLHRHHMGLGLVPACSCLQVFYCWWILNVLTNLQLHKELHIYSFSRHFNPKQLTEFTSFKWDSGEKITSIMAYNTLAKILERSFVMNLVLLSHKSTDITRKYFFRVLRETDHLLKTNTGKRWKET